MSYNPAIPLATDLISDSQADIYNNFQAISTWVQVDHVNFGNPTQGEHLQVTFASKNTPSAPTDPISVLYTGNSAGVAWPFLETRPLSIIFFQIQLIQAQILLKIIHLQ